MILQGTGTKRTGRTLSDSNAAESQICGAKPCVPLFTEGTNSKLNFDRKGKTVNMCLAMQAMRQEERQEGRQEGESRINRLNSLLIDLNRFEDLKRAARDSTYQAELLAELLPNQ